MGILTSLGALGQNVVCVILELKHWRHETLAHFANVIKHEYSIEKQNAWSAAWVLKKGVPLVLFSLGIQVEVTGEDLRHSRG